MEYLSLGKIIDAFSLDGTLKVISSTDNGKKRYQAGNKIFLYDPKTQERKELTVLNYRANGQIDFVKVDEITTKEEAESYRGYELHVIKDSKDLDEGYYFYSDLRGCKIIDQDNTELGIVKEVEEFPAQITLRVRRKEGAEFFVPFIKQFIREVDIDKKIVYINRVEGML